MKNAEMFIVAFESDDVIATSTSSSIPHYVPGTDTIAYASAKELQDAWSLVLDRTANGEYYVFKNNGELFYFENLTLKDGFIMIDPIGDPCGDYGFSSDYYEGDGWYFLEYDFRKCNESHHPFN